MGSALIDNSDVKFAKLLFNKGTENALSFNCLIKNIEKEHVNFIGMSEVSDKIHIGDHIDMRIYSSNGIVAAQATLLRIFELMEAPVYTTTYPETYDYTQKRAYYRADLHIPITLMIVLPNGAQRKITATTKNLGGRGLCYVSLEPEFPKAHSITVAIKFYSRLIIATANHVHTTPVMYKKNKLYIHAVKFTGIEPEDINFITRECFLAQLQHKKEQEKIKGRKLF